MNKTKVVQIAVAGLLIVLAALCGWLAFDRYHASANFSCTAGPDEECPSDQFYSDMKRVSKMDKDISEVSKSGTVREFQDKIDLRNGVSQRLNAQILEENKKGFGWNNDKGRFTKLTQEQISKMPPELQLAIKQTQQPVQAPPAGLTITPQATPTPPKK